jgi:hypothetical protein
MQDLRSRIARPLARSIGCRISDHDRRASWWGSRPHAGSLISIAEPWRARIRMQGHRIVRPLASSDPHAGSPLTDRAGPWRDRLDAGSPTTIAEPLGGARVHMQDLRSEIKIKSGKGSIGSRARPVGGGYEACEQRVVDLADCGAGHRPSRRPQAATRSSGTSLEHATPSRARRQGSGDRVTGLWIAARPMTSELVSMFDNTLPTGLFVAFHSPDARADSPSSLYIFDSYEK